MLHEFPKYQYQMQINQPVPKRWGSINIPQKHVSRGSKAGKAKERIKPSGLYPFEGRTLPTSTTHKRHRRSKQKKSQKVIVPFLRSNTGFILCNFSGSIFERIKLSSVIRVFTVGLTMGMMWFLMDPFCVA